MHRRTGFLMVGALLFITVSLFLVKDKSSITQTDQGNSFERQQNKRGEGQGNMDEREVIRSRLANRVERLNTVCDATHDAINMSASFESVKPIAYGRLLTCGIPKVGTTFTGHVLKQLFKVGKPNTTFTGRIKKYVIVREPYARMVSGYIDKIVTNQEWWKNYGTYIIKQYRDNPSPESKACGNNVSFPEFVIYLIQAQTTGRNKNSHWQPMNELCDFCQQGFDYIIHLETVKEDLKYIYESVNISVATDFSDERLTMNGKSGTIVRQRPETRKCENTCVSLGKVWWSFQARGLIADGVVLPVTGKQCDTITGDELADLTWKAHIESVGRIDKGKQKRDTLVKLFLQVPLRNRLLLRDLYQEDFDLFGYDPAPPDLFPELYLS